MEIYDIGQSRRCSPLQQIASLLFQARGSGVYKLCGTEPDEHPKLGTLKPRPVGGNTRECEGQKGRESLADSVLQPLGMLEVRRTNNTEYCEKKWVIHLWWRVEREWVREGLGALDFDCWDVGDSFRTGKSVALSWDGEWLDTD